jgi:amino acid permease
MCHHSIPSIIAPIRSKNKLKSLFAYDYICIALFYLLLSLTAVFTFSSFEDLYTLNFRPRTNCTHSDIEVPKFLSYFIALFPVFTLSSSFPIIGITLRNNLETILKSCVRIQRKQRIILVICVLLIPCTVSIITENINFLVGFTGSYAGVAVQYVIPALLVYNARRQAQLKLRRPIDFANQSFFQNKYWVFCVLLWAWLAVIVITVYNILPARIFQ